jgi:hypothetical protein
VRQSASFLGLASAQGFQTVKHTEKASAKPTRQQSARPSSVKQINKKKIQSARNEGLLVQQMQKQNQTINVIADPQIVQ